MYNWNEVSKDVHKLLRKHQIALNEIYWRTIIERWIEWYIVNHPQYENRLPLKYEELNILIKTIGENRPLWQSMMTMINEALENEVFKDDTSRTS